MPTDDEPGPSRRGVETRFLRRFAGPTRIAAIATMVVIVPFMVLMPVVFARDGRIGWTVGSTVIALATIILLFSMPLLGYRISGDGIASRQGIPPRFTDTMPWSDVAMITWMAGPIRGLTDNCTLWSSDADRPVRARSLYDAQTSATGRGQVLQHEEDVGPLTPMLITLSSLSRSDRQHLIAAFEQQGFGPLPADRRDHNSTVSRPTDHQGSLG